MITHGNTFYLLSLSLSTFAPVEVIATMCGAGTGVSGNIVTKGWNVTEVSPAFALHFALKLEYRG